MATSLRRRRCVDLSFSRTRVPQSGSYIFPYLSGLQVIQPPPFSLMIYVSPTDTLINRRLTRVFLSFFFLCPDRSGVSINTKFFRSRKNCTKPATGTNNFTEVELDISSPFFSLLQRYINFTLFSFILLTETIEAKEKLYFKIGDKIFFFSLHPQQLNIALL